MQIQSYPVSQFDPEMALQPLSLTLAAVNQAGDHGSLCSLLLQGSSGNTRQGERVIWGRVSAELPPFPKALLLGG